MGPFPRASNSSQKLFASLSGMYSVPGIAQSLARPGAKFLQFLQQWRDEPHWSQTARNDTFLST